MTTTVTPTGHAPTVWAARIDAGERVSLDGLRTRLGLGRGTPRLVVAAAHPDDETIGAGRLAYGWGQELGPVTAVLATAGEACFDDVMTRPARLDATRLLEWSAAMDVLEISGRHFLGLADGQVAAQQRQVEVGLETVVAGQQALGDGPVVLAAPWRHDPHPDHRAVGRAATAVAGRCGVPLLDYPVWMTYWTDLDDPVARTTEILRVDCGPAADAAHPAACACFVSQLQPWAPGLSAVVPPAMLAHHDRQLLLGESAPTATDVPSAPDPTGSTS